MLTALKWSGTSMTVGSLVAATTVRVIAGGAGAVCAAPEAGSAVAPSSSSSVVLNCMIASQVQQNRSTIRAPNTSWNGRRLGVAICWTRRKPVLIVAGVFVLGVLFA